MNLYGIAEIVRGVCQGHGDYSDEIRMSFTEGWGTLKTTPTTLYTTRNEAQAEIDKTAPKPSRVNPKPLAYKIVVEFQV